MGGVPEHDQIPQPVDQTQCGHNVRQIIPQQPCWTEGLTHLACVYGDLLHHIFSVLIPLVLQALYSQYLQFKEHDIPLKENEKTKIKNLYKMLEVYTYVMLLCLPSYTEWILCWLCCFQQLWIEFGRIQLPPGHHPNDIEKEWGKLIVAMLEREKSLRPEVERCVRQLILSSLYRLFLISNNRMIWSYNNSS